MILRTYLATKVDEGSPVGDLARDVARDIKDGGLPERYTVPMLKRRMLDSNACDDAFQALWTARGDARRA